MRSGVVEHAFQSILTMGVSLVKGKPTETQRFRGPIPF